MGREGLSTALAIIIGLVIALIIIALLGSSFLSRSAQASESQEETANSSNLRWCEETVESFCRFNPGGEWGSTYESCTRYKGVIDDNGDTTCSGTSQDGFGGGDSGDGGTTQDGSGDGSGDSTAPEGTGSDGGDLDRQKPAEEETQIYDVYFIPSSAEYGQTEEYRQRADAYFQAIQTMTPFREDRCQDVPQKHVFEDPENQQGDGYWDLLVEITDNNWCNASAVPARRKITVHNGLPSGWGGQAVVHEMGHVYNLCDLYSTDEYNRQNGEYEGGCRNPWPDRAWYPGGNIEGETEVGAGTDACTQVSSSASEAGVATCGAALDLNGDGDYTDDRAASIMGGGGAFKATYGPDGSIQSCSGLWIEQPAFAPQAYDAVKQELLSDGYCSTDSANGGDSPDSGPLVGVQ